MTTTNVWLEQQNGTVQQFEKVQTTFLNEDTGEMYCFLCDQHEKTRGNRARSFMTFIDQTNAFERFTERHLHGSKV